MKSETRNGLLEQLEARLREGQPCLNRYAILAAARAFFHGRKEMDGVPSASEASEYLGNLISEKGETAGQAEFAWLQIAASHLWGRQETAFFARVLRDNRVAPKKEKKTEWDRAADAIAVLPAEWQPSFIEVLEASRGNKRTRRRSTIWSASYIASVSRALSLWHVHCQKADHDTLPTGVHFQAFAQALESEDVTARSIQSYLQRILAGYSSVLQPGFRSDACAFVIEEYRRMAEQQGAVTKKGHVSALALYDLGFELMEMARQRPVLGIKAALQYRDGFMFSLGIALPQRARALSVLENGVTFGLDERPNIWVSIPGAALKMRQGQKDQSNFVRRLSNPSLWDALQEYLTVYRPIFDDGGFLFPSKTSPGVAISEQQIGRVTGNITEDRFGVRIPIHRFRDSAATEASEELENGYLLAPALLGHRDQRTTDRHYDHAEGVKGAKEFGALVQSMRTNPVELDL